MQEATVAQTLEQRRLAPAPAPAPAPERSRKQRLGLSIGLLLAATSCQELWGQTLQLDVRNCVASPSACAADQVCNPVTEVCESGLALDSVEPRRGPLAGGTLFTLHGRGFFPGTSVSLGGVSPTRPAVVLSDSELQAVLPPGRRGCGPIPITVKRPWGLEVSRADLFSYHAPTVAFDAPKLISENPSTWTVYVTTHDVNGDGILDVLATSYSHGGLEVLLGQGDGTFTSLPRFPTGANAYHIAIGDLNRDGLPDLAVANASGSASVLIGAGGGDFRAAVNLVNANAQSSQILDVNSDGFLDLAVLTRDGKLRLWSGDGTGAVTFLSETAVNAGTTISAAADLDGDGRIDLIVGGKTVMATIVLRNRGDGTFEELAPNLLGAYPTSSAVADMNGDGKLDVVAAEYTTGMTSVLLGRGDGTFEPRRSAPSGGASRIVALGDLNEHYASL